MVYSSAAVVAWHFTGGRLQFYVFTVLATVLSCDGCPRFPCFLEKYGNIEVKFKSWKVLENRLAPCHWISLLESPPSPSRCDVVIVILSSMLQIVQMNSHSVHWTNRHWSQSLGCWGNGSFKICSGGHKYWCPPEFLLVVPILCIWYCGIMLLLPFCPSLGSARNSELRPVLSELYHTHSSYLCGLVAEWLGCWACSPYDQAAGSNPGHCAFVLPRASCSVFTYMNCYHRAWHQT